MSVEAESLAATASDLGANDKESVYVPRRTAVGAEMVFVARFAKVKKTRLAHMRRR